MTERRSEGKIPHWNVKLHFQWKTSQRAKRRARNSHLTCDWEVFKQKRKEFTKENRTTARRSFCRRTGEILSSTDKNNVLAEAIKNDRKRRYERDKAQRTTGDTLDHAEFTRFMGTFHDQNQNTVTMTRFRVPEDMKDSLRRSIRKVKRNKSPGRERYP